MPLTAQEVWQQTLDILETKLNKTSFDTWLLTTKPLVLQNNALIIEVPNTFTRDWLQTHYLDMIKEYVDEITGQNSNVRFVLPQSESNFLHELEEDKPKISVQDPFEDDEFKVNPKYTFSSFVIGDSNRFAHAASVAVAEAPAKAYNPLFIYGGAGLGKTHLMYAIGHYARENYPNLKIVYISSEKFINEFITAIRDETTITFRNKYRNADILLIDDIQFLAGKDRTQIEFFHTFNALYEAKKQMVVSSDRPPKEIPTLEDRLRSRFEWGLITDIQPPDLETRVAILQKKSKHENYNITDQVLFYLAENIKSNIRELEGALTRINAYASFYNKPITLELVKNVLKDVLPQGEHKPLTIDLIQQFVSDYYSLTVEVLTSRRRTKNIAHPRQVAMYLSRELTDYSLPKIGEEFNGRDHTTVLHAYDKISSQIKTDHLLERDIDEIKKRITNR